MSLLFRTLAPLRAPSRAILAHRSAAATFSTTTSIRAMSEDDRDHPERAQKIDHHKGDSLKRQKSGDPEWKPELATRSEQDVQADKSKMSMEEMEKMGEKQAQEGKTPSGSSSSKV